MHETLEKLVERGYAERLPRRPGQKEERYRQLLGEEETEVSAPEAPPAASEDRLDRIERELAELGAQMQELRKALGEPQA